MLVGRDLIKAAEVRAQVTQIEKFNSAVNTFRGKYGQLPGDMDYATASRFGFAVGAFDYTRGGVLGMGDGNGLIEGTTVSQNYNSNAGYAIGAGEPVIFWSDLTYANGMNINLIQGSFNAAEGNGPWACSYGLPCGNGVTLSTGISLAFPQAAIGGGNYIYPYSQNGINYYGLSVISALTYWQVTAASGVSVRQAYAIDKKVDDGLPQSGNVTAYYVNGLGYQWAASGASVGISPGNAASPLSTSCYDNGGNASSPMAYSINQNNGTGVNCALSFKFQ